MILDFEKMENTVLEHFKGGEKELSAKMLFDGMNRIMYGRLVPGASIGMHMHDTGSEIIYLLEGSGRVLYDDGEETLEVGQCHYCPKGHSHSLINASSESDLIFFAVVPAQ